eukprot:2930799-Amphidinium_carterae.1
MTGPKVPALQQRAVASSSFSFGFCFPLRNGARSRFGTRCQHLRLKCQAPHAGCAPKAGECPGKTSW